MSTKVTIITGGSRGIGWATALMAGKAGHAVCVNYVTDQDAADAVCAELIAAGGKALAVPAEISPGQPPEAQSTPFDQGV